MTLLDQHWTEQQAQGLLDSLDLDGGPPKWKLEHLRRLRDWCSAHGEGPTTIDGQLPEGINARPASAPFTPLVAASTH
jgi:hypothetical protein